MSVDSSREFSPLLETQIETILYKLLGEPNSKLSNGKQLRWGNKGSLAVELNSGKAGTWFNHETGKGGSLLQLIKDKQGFQSLGDAWKWLQENFPKVLAAPYGNRPKKEYSQTLDNFLKNEKAAITHEYPYQNKAGKTVFTAFRAKTSGGEVLKRQWHTPRGSSLKLIGLGQLKDSDRELLYRLPEILDAEPGSIIAIAEGEKDAETLRELGFLATTNALGAGKWKSHYGEHFSGKHVLVFYDNDEPGRKHAADIIASVKNHALSVKQVRLPGLSDKEDITDWIEKGHTQAELCELIAKTRIIPKTGAWANELANMEFPEPQFIIERLLPEGLCILAGKPKLGKSWLALQICLAVSANSSLFGEFPCLGGQVLYLALEDNLGRMKKRLKKLGGLPINLRLETQWPKADQGGIEAIEKWLDEQKNPRLIVIDTLARFRAKQNSKADKYQEDSDALAGIQQLAMQRGISVLIVHHLRKQSDEDWLNTISGTTGLSGTADTNMVLQRSRGEMEGILMGSGRDIEDFEIPLNFNPQLDCWSKADVSLEAAKSTEKQRDIITLLEKNPEGLRTKEIADCLGRNFDNVNRQLGILVHRGLLVKKERGKYAILPERQNLWL